MGEGGEGEWRWMKKLLVLKIKESLTCALTALIIKIINLRMFYTYLQTINSNKVMYMFSTADLWKKCDLK